jgi:hypothetical protein
MDSIYDRNPSLDFYVEHMRRTMEWIGEKIEEHRHEPSHNGYHIEIGVEAQWLQQLVAECVAKHQMLMECQRQLGLAAAQYKWAERIVVSNEAKEKP